MNNQNVLNALHNWENNWSSLGTLVLLVLLVLLIKLTIFTIVINPLIEPFIDGTPSMQILKQDVHNIS